MKTKQKVVRHTGSFGNSVSSDLCPDVYHMPSGPAPSKRKQPLSEEIGVTSSSSNINKKMCTQVNKLFNGPSFQSIQNDMKGKAKLKEPCERAAYSIGSSMSVSNCTNLSVDEVSSCIKIQTTNSRCTQRERDRELTLPSFSSKCKLFTIILYILLFTYLSLLLIFTSVFVLQLPIAYGHLICQNMNMAKHHATILLVTMNRRRGRM